MISACMAVSVHELHTAVREWACWQGESYKKGIQAGPTIHTFLFSYLSLHVHENALLLSSLIACWWVRLQTLDGSDLKTYLSMRW